MLSASGDVSEPCGFDYFDSSAKTDRLAGATS